MYEAGGVIDDNGLLKSFKWEGSGHKGQTVFETNSCCVPPWPSWVLPQTSQQPSSESCPQPVLP